MRKKLIQISPFLIFLAIGLIVRLYNFPLTTFFTWDNGRDYFAVQKIAQGDLTLIGPTTGIQGFFLGPFWYYLGLPGYLVANGSPYLFLLFYDLIALLALPAFWYLGQLLFPQNKKIAVILAYLLSLMPGSIWGTIRVWNPQITILLLTLYLIFLLKANKRPIFLFLVGLMLGLILQAEFVYGVVLLVTLPFSIIYLRGKLVWKEQLYAWSALFLTLIPQLLFEFKNHFLMSKAFLLGAQVSDSKYTWLKHFSGRPWQLIDSTNSILLNQSEATGLLNLILILLAVAGGVIIFRRKNNKIWKLISMLAVFPYVFYLFWRGNNGYFFSYYLTPHFIILLPLILIALLSLSKYLASRFELKLNSHYFFLGVLAIISGQYFIKAALFPVNNSGLNKMDIALTQIFTWIAEDQQDPGVIRVYTPNAETEHYDVIIHWKAKQLGVEIPLTVKTDQTEVWYVLLEPENESPPRFAKWYLPATAGGTRLKQEKIGNLTVEKWVKNSD